MALPLHELTYEKGFNDALAKVADWIEEQRIDVPAHGWEFAEAIREMGRYRKAKSK